MTHAKRWIKPTETLYLSCLVEATAAASHPDPERIDFGASQRRFEAQVAVVLTAMVQDLGHAITIDYREHQGDSRASPLQRSSKPMSRGWDLCGYVKVFTVPRELIDEARKTVLQANDFWTPQSF